MLQGISISTLLIYQNPLQMWETCAIPSFFMLPKMDSSINWELCQISQQGAHRKQSASYGCYPGHCAAWFYFVAQTSAVHIWLNVVFFYLHTLPTSFVWSWYKIWHPARQSMNVLCELEILIGKKANKERFKWGFHSRIQDNGEATEVK